MGRASESLIICGSVLEFYSGSGTWMVWMGIIGAVLRYEEIAKTISKSRG